MALEQYKTQVLLLHSHQSTLDALSAGFSDRYAVHVATSGAEALNTLGETPIHVIVSAQDLPGMSGLEALREARKRSPDTIGILLAGDDPTDGLEAMVGDQEVFQVVRGAITPNALQELIDAATRRVRMLTISESANDQAANVDEPVGEHIVLETSDNGTSIISGGTGRFQALKSSRPQAAPNAPGRDVDVLVLTKEDDFLETVRDSSQGLHTVHHANTPTQAEALVREHKIGVLVTDAAMAGSNIEIITERLRRNAPRLVAVVAGRRDDGELLMDLINRGQVYRFLLKPVSPGRARLAIEASVKYHLEAPDESFKGKARSDTPASAEPRKPPKGGNVARIAPKAGAAAAASERPARKPDSAAPARPPETDVNDEPDAALGRLDTAFGDSGRFRRTVNDLAATVGKSLGAGEEATDRAGPARKRPKFLALGAAVVAIVGVAALGWWFVFGDAQEPPTDGVARDLPATEFSPSVVETDIPARQPGAPPPAYQALLNEARKARDRAAIIAPPGSNAIELYVAARKIAPEEPVILVELGQAVDDALRIAEQALLEQRTADAARALRMVRLADAENARLPFLDAQVAQLQLRAYLDQARAAISEHRFEDAGIALTSAEAAAGLTPDIERLTNELANARSEQQLDEVLALASARLQSNALTTPANDNARYYYELALSSDPENTVARQGLTIVASKLVLQARQSIDAGELDNAERLLRNARALDPQSADLNASLQALQSAKDEQAAAMLAEAERQAELEAVALGADAGSEAGEDAPFSPASPQDPFAAVAAGSASGNSTAAMTPGRDGSGADAEGAGGYVAISTLTRTNYVAPRYPRMAQRRNVTGWVDVSFTVGGDGEVVNVDILDSNPGNVFNDAAREAVSQWRFEPSLEMGRPVEKRVAVRLMFDLQ